MKKSAIIAFLLILFPAVSGCLRENPTVLAETRIFTDGDLALKTGVKEQKSLYIEAVDQNGQPIRFPEKAIFKTAGNNFIVVDSPSAAAFILHVDILHEGEVDEKTLKNLVQAGFGSQAKFGGTGNEALLADALLVKRRVPNEKKEHISNLKNISARNALDSAKMRIGILIPGKNANTPAIHDELAEALLKEMERALGKK